MLKETTLSEALRSVACSYGGSSILVNSALAAYSSCAGTRLSELRVKRFPATLNKATMHQAVLAIRAALHDESALDQTDKHKPRGPLRILRCLAKALVLESKRLGYHNLQDPNAPLSYLRL